MWRKLCPCFGRRKEDDGKRKQKTKKTHQKDTTARDDGSHGLLQHQRKTTDEEFLTARTTEITHELFRHDEHTVNVSNDQKERIAVTHHPKNDLKLQTNSPLPGDGKHTVSKDNINISTPDNGNSFLPNVITVYEEYKTHNTEIEKESPDPDDQIQTESKDQMDSVGRCSSTPVVLSLDSHLNEAGKTKMTMVSYQSNVLGTPTMNLSNDHIELIAHIHSTKIVQNLEKKSLSPRDGKHTLPKDNKYINRTDNGNSFHPNVTTVYEEYKTHNTEIEKESPDPDDQIQTESKDQMDSVGRCSSTPVVLSLDSHLNEAGKTKMTKVSYQSNVLDTPTMNVSNDHIESIVDIHSTKIVQNLEKKSLSPRDGKHTLPKGNKYINRTDNGNSFHLNETTVYEEYKTLNTEIEKESPDPDDQIQTDSEVLMDSVRRCSSTPVVLTPASHSNSPGDGTADQVQQSLYCSTIMDESRSAPLNGTLSYVCCDRAASAPQLNLKNSFLYVEGYIPGDNSAFKTEGDHPSWASYGASLPDQFQKFPFRTTISNLSACYKSAENFMSV